MRKLLIANRGEIAVRVARAAADLGIAGVAVYSGDDSASAHVRRADEAVALPGRGPGAYLDIEAILAAARRSEADAIHPGYGFLSENAAFARAVEARGLTFVGPASETLDAFGDKVRARALAADCGVPVLAGSGPVDAGTARDFLAALPAGAAMLIKAVAGGGGRGMRLVRAAGEIEAAIESAAAEAAAAFGDSAVYVEEYLPAARHIEVQVIGDGAAVEHLWERECSLQRRHQKLVEIAPCPGLDPAVREAILEAALRIARRVSYRSLGTLEFLLAEDGRTFRFIEANARLQVEHTITEAVLGLDLVRSQIEIARGRSLADLGLTAKRIGVPRGYAVQARINLETMQGDGSVRPGGGRLSVFETPGGPGVRTDTYGQAGYETNPAFDSLIAKVICHSPSNDFALAAAKTGRALAETRIEGAPTNLTFLRALLSDRRVIAGAFDTGFIDANAAGLVARAEALGTGAQPPPSAAPAAAVSSAEADDGARAVRSPMAGTVARVTVTPGEAVWPGRLVAVLEAMKMEHEVRAAEGGRVLALAVRAGAVVFEGSALVRLGDGEAVVSADAATDGPVAGRGDDAWRADLDELARREALALAMGGPEGIARQRKQGKLTARERIDALADPGSFREFMALSGDATYENGQLSAFTPKGYVNGQVKLDGRKVFVTAGDFTVRGGSGGTRGGMGQELSVTERAIEWRLPYVRLLDASGGSVRTFEELGRTYLPDGNAWTHLEVKALSVVPTVSAVLGSVAGLPAIYACLAHFNVMVKGISQIFPGGPPVVKAALGVDITKEELGGDHIHTRLSGCVNNLAETELDALAQIRRFLSYLPSSVHEAPPRGPSGAQVEQPQDALLDIVPRDRRQSYDAHAVLRTLVDRDSFFELSALYGRARITGLARIDGWPVAIMANNPRAGGGLTDVAAGAKVAQLIQLCDTFHLPMISLADEPGFMVGLEAELQGIERAGARLVAAVCNSRMPWLTVVMGKLYGVAGQCHHRPSGMFRRYAWPSANWGSMHIAGGVAAAYRREIEAAADPEAKRREIEARLNAFSSPFRTAEATGQDIIDPRATRERLVEFVEEAQAVLRGQIGPPVIPYLP